MYIDPHAHMISRTTNDYEAMAAAGIVALIEPAFWVGQPRTYVGTYIDYLSAIVGWERFRAGQFGIRHYCTAGLNSKEANNEELAEGVMEILPRFALKDGVVAIGEIGYDEQTPLEDKYFRAQLELAKELQLPVMIHTPHRDKKRGTTRSMDVAMEHGLDPSKVVVDHNNEETVGEVLQRGFWAAFSIYPSTKMGDARMVQLLRQYGAERIIVEFRLAIGACPNRWACRKLRNWRSEAAFPSDMCAWLATKMRLPLTARADRCAKATGWTRRRSTSAPCSPAIPFCGAAANRASSGAMAANDRVSLPGDVGRSK